MSELPTNATLNAVYVTAAGSGPVIPGANQTASAGGGGSHWISTSFPQVSTVDLWEWADIVGESLPGQSYILSDNLVLSTGYLRVGLTREYEELGGCLAALASDVDSEWKIDAPVFEVAQFVATELMENAYPAPRLLVHSPTSVVFFWGDGAKDLYLTVGAENISGLVMAKNEIEFRFDFPRSALPRASILRPALESARLGRPVMLRDDALRSRVEPAV
jgi:hypothetical protein